jgi:hypothetical protein
VFGTRSAVSTAIQDPTDAREPNGTCPLSGTHHHNQHRRTENQHKSECASDNDPYGHQPIVVEMCSPRYEPSAIDVAAPQPSMVTRGTLCVTDDVT